MEVRIPSGIPDLTVRTDGSSEIDDENFEIYSSSDEDDGNGGKREWEPALERIIELYNRIAKGDLPELIWKCPGRREPSVDGDYEDDIEESTNLEEEDEKPTAFDFDSMCSEPSQPFGQRKTPGTLKVQQKRVARLDKILSDMKKDTSVYQLQSPRVPFQANSRLDNSPGPGLFGMQTTPIKPENLGIPLPSAYTLTSPQAANSNISLPGMNTDIKSDITTPVSEVSLPEQESGTIGGSS